MRIRKRDSRGRIVSRPLSDRFWEKVERVPGDDCWEWQGYIFPNGYGGIVEGRRTLLTHRVAWRLVNGSIPKGLNVLHRCDNRKCVHLDHLFLGTQADNMADMDSKGRRASQDPVKHVGENNGASKLTEQEVRAMRDEYIPRKNSYPKLARKFGVSRFTVEAIITRKIWTHI